MFTLKVLLCSNLSDIPSYMNVNTTGTDKDHVKDKSSPGVVASNQKQSMLHSRNHANVISSVNTF